MEPNGQEVKRDTEKGVNGYMQWRRDWESVVDGRGDGGSCNNLLEVVVVVHCLSPP